MNFIKELYFGKTVVDIEHDFNLILKKFKKYEGIKSLYLICICDGDNLFEIIPSALISKDAVKRKNYTVAGIANGKEEAFLLAADIICDYIKKFPGRDFSLLKEILFK